MNIGFFTNSKLLNKASIGSSMIRAEYLVKYWPEAEIFKYGRKYDCVIFQKCYLPSYAEGLDCKKILDVCDPDWLSNWIDIKRMIEAVDGVTCSSPYLKEYLSGITDKPVIYLPDRHDMEFLKEKKIHKGDARKLVWFGYAHNAHTLKPLFKYLDRFRLTIISDNKERLSEHFTKEEIDKIKFVKFDIKTINKELIKNDIGVMPGSMVQKDKYKSNNKTTWLQALNIPVVNYSDDLLRLVDEGERIKEADKWYNKIRKEYDCKLSVKELKEFIGKL